MLARSFRLNRLQLISHGAALISPRGLSEAEGRQRKQAANDGNDRSGNLQRFRNSGPQGRGRLLSITPTGTLTLTASVSFTAVTHGRNGRYASRALDYRAHEVAHRSDAV